MADDVNETTTEQHLAVRWLSSHTEPLWDYDFKSIDEALEFILVVGPTERTPQIVSRRRTVTVTPWEPIDNGSDL